VLEVQRTKLDNRSVKCIFLGVSEESKGYRLFNLITERVIVSRDVIFEEEKQWDWDESFEEQILMDLEWGDDNVEGVDDNNGESENNSGEKERCIFK
jgi:hypothetical protein